MILEVHPNTSTKLERPQPPTDLTGSAEVSWAKVSAIALGTWARTDTLTAVLFQPGC